MRKKQSAEMADEVTEPCCSPQYMYPPDDEIDLLDLFRLLWARKNIIICLTLTGVLIAGIYAFSRPVVYQSEARFTAPLKGQTVQLLGQPFLTATDVYNIFIRHISSNQLQKEVLVENKLTGYSFTINNKKNKGSVALLGGDPAKLAIPVNLLLRRAESKAQAEINNLVAGALQQRLPALQEALAIAEMAGVAEPVLTEATAPLYFYGSKILKAEIFFIEKYRLPSSPAGDIDSLTGKNGLSGSRLVPLSTGIRAVRLLQPAITPSQPVSQRRSLIVVLGFFLGFMVAIFAVFALNMKDKIGKDK